MEPSARHLFFKDQYYIRACIWVRRKLKHPCIHAMIVHLGIFFVLAFPPFSSYCFLDSTSVLRLFIVFTGFDVCTYAFLWSYYLCLWLFTYRKSHVAISKFRGQENSAEGIQKRHAKKRASNFVQVLLILIQHGANGLNLLEAEHVVLVEPLLNPATEAQAISRVHRIGQQKRTLVHRFIVRASSYLCDAHGYQIYIHKPHTRVRET